MQTPWHLVKAQIDSISLKGESFISVKKRCLSSIIFVETLLSHQYSCVLILNCFIVNNKGGNRKRKRYFVTI